MKRKQTESEINLFRAIEVFMTVGEMHNVTEASAALGMTQSAVSQQIKKLEWSLGAPLFDRSTRPIVLTHAGQILQRRGYRILNEIEDLRSELRHIQSSSMPILRIAMLASIATTLTTGVYDMVRNELAIPELNLSAGLAGDHELALKSRQVDLAVTADPQFDLSEFTCISVLDEPFYLVLPESYDGQVDDIDTVASQLSLVRFSPDALVGRRTDQHLLRCRMNLPRTMEADRASMIVASVTTGKCFAILTPSLLIDAVAEGMRLRIEPLPMPGFRRSISVVARDTELGDIPIRVAQTCVRLLRENFDLRFPSLQHDVIYHC